MHVCHVITRLIIGGAQENTVLTCRGLRSLSYRVTLLAGPETGPEGSLWGQAEASGCELIRVDSLRRSINPLTDWRCHQALRELFTRLRPDIVHTHSSKAGILGRFAAAKAGVPIILHTIHGMSFNRTQPRLTQCMYQMLERRAARMTTAFITVADAMITQSLAAGIGARAQFTTIRSGMEVECFLPSIESRRRSRARWGFTDEHIVVGTVARLFVNKGYEDLIRALPAAVESMPLMRFVWIGDGPHRDRYLAQLSSLGLADRVVLTGLVPPEELPELLNGFDLLVHASRWEGLPRALVQALLVEVPVISYDNDGAPEVVLDEQTGLLVPFGDTLRLSQAIQRLSRDSDLRRRLGRRGREHCLAAYDWRRMVRQIDELYRSIAHPSSVQKVL